MLSNPTALRLERLYKQGRLNDAAIQNAVNKGLLTPDEAEAILHPENSGDTNTSTEA